MSEHSSIEWTNASWNPWQGCHKVSAGCKNCYMFREKTRYGQEPNVVVRSKPNTFNLPLRLKEPQLVFTGSWSDFFIEEADAWRAEAWDIIHRTPHLTYQIVTKRIERAAELLPWGDGEPWPNVWLIVSAENQPTADQRIPLLLQTLAAVRGVSLEPLLGPVDLSCPLDPLRSLDGFYREQVSRGMFNVDQVDSLRTPIIDWVICGGESGAGARPVDIAWLRDILRQCRDAGVPCFVKQLGRFPVIPAVDPDVRGPAIIEQQRRIDLEWPAGTHFGNPTGRAELNGRIALLKDAKGGDPAEWPEDLRVREYPR